jgi:hypothetical protein
MYRISRVFETPSVAIVKIAGQVMDAELEAWRSFIDELGREGGPGSAPTRWTVLDFCDVASIGREAAETLVKQVPETVLLLNTPTCIRNMMATAGLSRQVLEAKAAESAAAGATHGEVLT